MPTEELPVFRFDSDAIYNIGDELIVRVLDAKTDQLIYQIPGRVTSIEIGESTLNTFTLGPPRSPAPNLQANSAAAGRPATEGSES